MSHTLTLCIVQVTRGMKLMFTDKVIPIWVTFGIQTLLDIQDIIDYRIGEGEGTMSRSITFECVIAMR